MKNYLFKKLGNVLFALFLILVSFTSCQNEETEITDTNTEQTFDNASELAQSILSTTTFDGSFDNILDGLWHFIETLQLVYPRQTRGYSFLVGSISKKVLSAGTYKRYMMYLRWMVRKDALDMGLWSKIDKKDLLMPLDTHTFQVSRRLGLLKRKTYDMRASIELTDTLRTFDQKDPIKYDFALYRLGQEKLV